MFLIVAAQTVPVTSNFEIDNLKAKIAAIKADIRQEQGMSEGYASAELEVRKQMCIPSLATAVIDLFQKMAAFARTRGEAQVNYRFIEVESE